MQVTTIHYNQRFAERFQKLPLIIKKKALIAEQKFRLNAFHPSLRLHKLSGRLKGLWSISIDKKYRILFEALEDGNIVFNSIGTHAIYEN